MNKYMNGCNLYEVRSTDLIHQYLETERRYAAYAIGDLDPTIFTNTRWWAADFNQEILAMVMLYEGLDPSILFTMGDQDGIRLILSKAQLSYRVYLTCKEEHVIVLRSFYSIISPIMMWRMVLTGWNQIGNSLECVKLNEGNLPEIIKLFEIGGGTGFSPNQLPNGVFYGIYDNHKLVAMAGTHLVNIVQNIAAVGNVVTHPDYRGKGYATMTTRAVINELDKMRIRDIVLSVAQDNTTAISVYSKIGFEIHCPFIEGLAEVPLDSGRSFPVYRNNF